MKGEGEKATALKKGPWTAEEDAVLVEYVNGHGEGNWNSVQKRTGLARCGKSCRLRWANHLRPNLKKGHFTPEEEAAILRLHAQMGNKWARMATQLPGRTDNEIKNYWNTRTKRLQRAGLPLYPPEIVHHHHQQQQQQKQQRRVAVRGRGIVHRNAAAGGPMVMPFFFVGDSAGCMAPPRPRTVPVDYGQMPKLPVTTTGLPSSQLFFGETSGGGGGLLDMLLLQQVADGNGSREQMQDELQLLDQPAAMVKLGDSDSSTGGEPETANGSSTTAAAINGEATEDQMKLLVDTIPTPTMPALPEWCGCNGGEICNGTQSVETNDELRLEMETSVAAEPIEQDWSIGSFPWNNMPGICWCFIFLF